MPRTCPHCGTDYADDTVICVPCGIDLRTGEELQTEADPVRGPSAPRQTLQFVGDLMPGLFRPVVLLPAILVACLGLGILVFGWILFASGIAITAVFVMAGGLIVYAHGIAWVLAGGFMLLQDALVDFEGKHWAVFFAFVSLPFIAFFTLLHLASQAIPPG